MKFKVTLFDIYIFLITLGKGLNLRADDISYMVLFLAGSAAILVKIFHERWSLRELLSVLFFVVIGLLDYLIGHTTRILFTAIGICGLKNVDIRHTFKVVLTTRLFCFSTMIIFSMLGIIDNSPLRFLRGNNIILRYSFGYHHANMTHIELTIIMALVLYFCWKKFTVIHFGLLLAVDYTFYRFTYSRTGFLIGVLIIMAFMCLKISRLRKLVLFAGRYSYWALFGVTLALGLLYGRIDGLETLNQLLTGRLYYLRMLFTTSFPPLIGHQVQADILIDNGYTAMLYEGGILAFLWISYYMTRAIKKMCIEKQYAELTLAICFILYNMTESFYPSISINVTLIFIGGILFEKRRADEAPDHFHSDIQP